MKELTIPEDLKEVQACVYRIWYDNHYVVVMANQLEWSITSIRNDLNRFTKGVKDGFSVGNLYGKFYHYIIANPGCDFSVQVVLRTESKYHLLKQMQIELAEGMNDERCLNSTYTPYINKKLQSNKTADEKGKPLRKGQVNRGTVLNFLRWKKKTYPNII